MSSSWSEKIRWDGRSGIKSGIMSKFMKSADFETRGKWAEAWRRNKSIVLMIVSQLISSLMAVAAKILQTSNEECGNLDTSQVLVTMMAIMMVLSWLWMWLAKVPEAPLGERKMWALLSLRGITGVFGVWGFYYSLRYLPLAEATVINFLAPMVATFTSILLIGTPFTVGQLVAGAISIVGVLLVSQPWRIFVDNPLPDVPEIAHGNYSICTNCTMPDYVSPKTSATAPVTAFEQASAIAAALVGVAGGAAAYVAVTSIGKRAHSAVITNYFSAWTVLLTSIGFVVTGFDEFRMPNMLEWGILVFMGTFGLIMQMLQAASLQEERSNRALNMVYTQIVFALIMDKAVFDLTPNWIGLLGSALILGSVIAVAIMKDKVAKDKGEKGSLSREALGEEEMEMMVPGDERRDSYDGER